MGPINGCLTAVMAHSPLPMIIKLPAAARANLEEAEHANPVKSVLACKCFYAFLFHLAVNFGRAIAARFRGITTHFRVITTHSHIRAIIIHITVIFLPAAPFWTLVIVFIHGFFLLHIFGQRASDAGLIILYEESCKNVMYSTKDESFSYTFASLRKAQMQGGPRFQQSAYWRYASKGSWGQHRSWVIISGVASNVH